MRTIYLDTLICVNLFIDYIILCAIKMLLHINCKASKILLGALFGAVSTITVLIPINSIFLSATLKTITIIVLIFTAYGKTTLRKFIIRCLMFSGISMILSSFVVTLNLMWKPEGVFIYNNELYFDISPTLLIISTGVMYFIINIYKRISAPQKLNCKIYKVTFSTQDNNKYSFESALDTGCSLTEPFSGLPVILTEKVILDNLNIPENKMRIIPYNTAAGSDYIYGFRPINIEINGKKLNSGCYIGLCDNKINGEVRSILGPRIAEVL